MSAAAYHPSRGVIARWREFLPAVRPETPVVTLHEGSTPLLHSPRLSEKVGHGARVFLKYEALNPTCSFKDRGMTVAVSKAVELGARAIVCASTGNTSASAAAYAARAGIPCIVLLPAGRIAASKLVQAFAYGAKVISIEGNFDDALRLVRELGDDAATGAVVVNSINPHRIEGQKTAAFEIIDELGDAPDVHFLPVGNAGNITAHWRGYREFHELGRAQKLPRLAGFQAAGAAPIYFRRRIENPQTIASAICIGNPASWAGADDAIAGSRGAIDIVTDAEILEAQSWLAQREGIFAEPGSIASVAGLLRCLEPSRERCATCPLQNLPGGANIVCTLTGHGLKDPESANAKTPNVAVIAPTKEAVLREISR